MASRGIPAALKLKAVAAYAFAVVVSALPFVLTLWFKAGSPHALDWLAGLMLFVFPVCVCLAPIPLLLLLRKADAPESSKTEGQGGPFAGRNAQLIHAGRLAAMGEMVPGVAHELNQPLCVLRGYLELLKMSLAEAPVMKERNLDEIFDICIKSVDKASKIVGQMRNFVRQKPMNPKPCDLRKPLEEGLAFFNEQIKQHNIELAMGFEAVLPEVMIDPQKFEQIAVNLLANARASVDAKGEALGREYKKRIELRLKHDKKADKVVFEVFDNGFGMKQETIDRCKEPFFTTKAPGEGTGLGVSIVKEILREAGGELKIESVQGENCVFRAIFPVCHESA